MNSEVKSFFDESKVQQLQTMELRYDKDAGACVNLLATEFSFQPAPCPSIESFLLYRSFNPIGVIETYRVTSAIPEIAIYQIYYSWTSGGGRYITRHFGQSFLALLSLNKEYPSTCILKETLQTKIQDWFTNEDVDFASQKEFSKQFHMVSSDKTKLEMLLKDRPLDELTAFPKMEAEIHGKNCLLRVSKDTASEYDIRELIKLAKKMYSIFS